MKLIVAFLLLAIPVFAQEPCALKIVDAPSLHGLSLGMSPEAAQGVVGRELKIKIKKNGNRVFFQNFVKKPPPAALAGVRAIYLRFFNRRLYQIEIFYEESDKWKTLADFTADLSINLKLPAAWENIKGRSGIKCDGFIILADNVLNPRVELTDVETAAASEKFETEKK